MQSTVPSPPVRSADLEFYPVFSVVIAYEDFETGKHAKVTYDYLVEHLGRDCTFTNQMWKFDVLSVSKLADIAAKDAMAADIVIISTHGEGDLPSHVKAWIESWVSEKGNPIALVALFDCPPCDAYQTSSIRSYLADVAKRGQMEFFAQPDDWPGQQRHETNRILQQMPLNDRAFSVIAGAVQHDSFPRWGINE